MSVKKIRTEIHDAKDGKLNVLISSGFYKNKTEAVNTAIEMLFMHHLKQENERSALEQANLYDNEMISVQGIHK
ncbi:MAG: hypothetical protein V4591_07285 [Bdellovibrionota bacterium]